jgi:hypothetical protein
MAFAFEPLPLVIGVTGHVDLRETDIPLLTTEVDAVFARLECDYANPESRFGRSGRMQRHLTGRADKPDGETPMIVLSTLAAGAGQLVTEVALTRGLQVIAPLPLPIDAYRRDFEWDVDRPDTLMTFEAWMAHPDIHKLFVGYERGNAPEDVRHHGHKRNLQYRRAGAFIARYCDVLLALWDGKTDTSAGSAAEIVAFKRHGFPPGGSARACLDAPEIGPVIHIVTPRAMKRDTAPEVSAPCWGTAQVGRERDAARRRGAATHEDIAALDHDFRSWRSFEASMRQSRDFNRDAARLLASAPGRASAGQSFMGLFEVDRSKPGTQAPALKAGAIAPRGCVSYAVADALARYWKNAFRRDWRWLSGLGLFAFGCFEAFAHLARAAHGLADLALAGLALLSGAIGALAAIFILYSLSVARRHRERSLDYRALAEALRVAVFWKLAGIDGAADAWPARMPRELAWAKSCLLRHELSDMTSPPPAGRASLDETSYDWIRRIWIAGRLRSFQTTRSKNLDAAGWRERGAVAILAAVAALAAVLLVLALRDGAVPGQPVRELLLFAISLLPGGAAFLVGYAEKLAFNATARQRDRMAELFARALAVLPPTLDETTPDLARNVVRELGVEAMRETASWVSLRRPRPMQGP